MGEGNISPRANALQVAAILLHGWTALQGTLQVATQDNEGGHAAPRVVLEEDLGARAHRGREITQVKISMCPAL